MVEIGNEVNLPRAGAATSPEAYVRDELLPTVLGVRAAARDAGKKVTILLGALAPTDWTGGVDPVQYLTAVYTAQKALGVDLFDTISWHPYTGGDDPRSSFHLIGQSAALYAVMCANGDAAHTIWATEAGSPTGGPNSCSEAEQASRLTATAATWYAQPFAGPIFWYCGRDTGTSNDDREQHFGLLRYDGSAKPALAKVRSSL